MGSTSPLTVERAVTRWLGDGKAQGWSPRTLTDRENTMDRFRWWLEHVEKASPTLAVGRFGCDRESAKREARPATVNAYFRILRAFSNFCLEEGLMAVTPLKNVKAPRVPTDQVKPFDPEQIQALVDAARRTTAPERNVAVILTLLDTGMRASELMGLKIADVDRGSCEFTVTGKGNKKRSIFMGVTCRRALWRYMEAERRDAQPDEPLFVSVGGMKAGLGFTISGLHDIVAKAGAAAGIKGVRCSPHTLRHTFAMNFLRGGGNLFELQQLMGHADLTVLRRYVTLAQADLAQAHRSASPADRMKLR